MSDGTCRGRCGPLCQHPGCWQSSEPLKGLPSARAYMGYVANIISKHSTQQEKCKSNSAILPALTVQSLDDALPTRDAALHRRGVTVPIGEGRSMQGHTPSHTLQKVSFSEMVLVEDVGDSGSSNEYTVTPVLIWRPGRRQRQKGKQETSKLTSREAVKVMNLADQVCLEERVPELKSSPSVKPKVLRRRSRTVRSSADNNNYSYLQDIPPHIIQQLLEHLRSASSASLGNKDQGCDLLLTTHQHSLSTAHKDVAGHTTSQSTPLPPLPVDTSQPPPLPADTSQLPPLPVHTRESPPLSSHTNHPPPLPAHTGQPPLLTSQPPQLSGDSSQLPPLLQPTPLPAHTSPPPAYTEQPAPGPLPASIIYDILTQMLWSAGTQHRSPSGYSRMLAERPCEVLKGYRKPPEHTTRGGPVATTTLTLPECMTTCHAGGGIQSANSSKYLTQPRYPYGNPVLPRMSTMHYTDGESVPLPADSKGYKGQQLGTNGVLHISSYMSTPREPKTALAPKNTDVQVPSAPKAPHTIRIPNCSEAAPKTLTCPAVAYREPGVATPEAHTCRTDEITHVVDTTAVFSPDHTVVSAKVEEGQLLLLDSEGKVVHQIPDSEPKTAPDIQQTLGCLLHQ